MTEIKLVTAQPYIDALVFCADHGDLVGVRKHLKQAFHPDFLSDEMVATLACVRAFLEAAEAIEEKYGDCSLLDLDHPRVAEGVATGVVEAWAVDNAKAYHARPDAMSAKDLWETISGSADNVKRKEWA